MRSRTMTVGPADEGLRLGNFLHGSLGGAISARAVKREIERGCCFVAGELCTRASRRLVRGERVVFRWGGDPHGERRLVISAGGILYEDNHYLVYDKPAGHPCQPTGGGPRHDLHNHLLSFIRARDGQGYLGQVHRLDRDTSGVILYVKDRALVQPISQLFRRREIGKDYTALVRGHPDPSRGVWRSRLRRRRGQERWELTSSRAGRTAITSFEVERTIGSGAALVTLMPRTGRTHQLRVQLAAAGHPILGDILYGREGSLRPGPGDWLPQRHLLHARRLSFVDPVGGRLLEVCSPVPADFEEAIRALIGDAGPGEEK